MSNKKNNEEAETAQNSFLNEIRVAPADQQITDEEIKNNILSTRMRIFGLRKLGINKSSEIAQMLNISIRTVYNNR